jgi:4-hydroxy-4-methyl-2-oxoglutarate aldolase
MGRNIVVRTIDRADPETIAALAAAGVATVHEAAGKRGLLDSGVRPIQEGKRIAGSAVTVSCTAGDNMMIHAAVEVVQEGDVLVVATTAPSTHGMVGELLAVSLRARSCRGLVVDAGVRDVADLRAMGFPVWSRAIHAQGTEKAAPGSVNTPIAIAGVTIEPGDVIVADDDGVMVVPRGSTDEVRRAAEQRIVAEETTRRRLADGELGVDFYGLRERLEALGVRWVDRADDA